MNSQFTMHHITEMPNDWYTGHWFSGPGWYFPDETEGLIGPYDTEDVARTEQYRYAQSL